jgi:hypothetical protein
MARRAVAPPALTHRVSESLICIFTSVSDFNELSSDEGFQQL